MDVGFRLPERIVEFEFEGEYAGGVVRARVSPIPMDIFFSITTLLASGQRTSLVEARDSWVEHALVDWNLRTVGGAAIPATKDGAAQLSVEVIAALLGTWTREVSEIPIPLLRRSGSGVTSGEPTA